MQRWINLIMQCVSTVSYSILINGVAHGNITPTRGLRQGDPLSLYLFLLYAERLSALIHEVARNNQISGISICRGCPIITHLFFADDSLLFCKANTQEGKNLVEILGKYEATSRQKVDTDKSTIFFSPNTTMESREEILNILGPMQGIRHNKYLGLPSIIGKSKTQVFAEIKEKVGEEACWMERKASLQWGKRDSHQSNGSSSANLHNELFPIAQKPL